MGISSLLNVPKTLEDWHQWSFNNALDHQKIIQKIQATTGNIISVTLTSGGSGYTSFPTIILDSNGSGAEFSINASNGVITGITLTAEGTGYKSTLFQFSGGGATIPATGVITLNPIVMLPVYQLDPINFQSPEDFIWRHAQTHTDMNGALGLQSVDLSELDINDPNKVAAWIYSNYQEHNNVHEKLGI